MHPRPAPAPRFALAALATLCLGACATGGASPATPAAPAASIDAILSDPELEGVHWGILAFEPATGDTLYRRNLDHHFVPASNQKILTTVAGVLVLGADHRFDTGLWATGPVRDGTLAGDLVLAGTGDPTLSSRFWPDSLGVRPLEALADSVVAAGIRTVDGRLVVDVSRWDSTTVEGTWMVDDLPFGYAATGGGFALEEGVTEVVVEGTRPGQPARISWRPVGSPDFVRSEVLTVAADDSVARVRPGYLPESRRLHLRGGIPAGETDTLRFATRDPVAQAARELHRALEAAGVSIGDGLEVAWDGARELAPGCRAVAVGDCPGARRVAALGSPPFMEVAEAILEPSQNWMAEQVVRYLGLADGRAGGRSAGRPPASWDAGLDVLVRVLADSLGVDTLDVHPRDGSGLSAYNLVTPRAMGRILAGVARRPWGVAYRAALAEPGEDDSTLERRLEGLEGRFHAKTGTITHVNSLSGYLTTRDGRELVVVLLSNGSGLRSSTVRAALDRMVRALDGEAPTSPPPAPPGSPGTPPR